MSSFKFEDRCSSIGASEAKDLMSDDPDKWVHLYRLKTDKAYYEKNQADVDQMLIVRAGRALEELNRQVTEEQLGVTIFRGTTIVTKTLANTPLSATPDGIIHDTIEWQGVPIEGPFTYEAKACGGWQVARERLEHYYPQIQQQMLVCGTTQCVFALFIGNTEHFRTIVAKDVVFCNELVKRADRFWTHVALKKPPAGAPPKFKYIVPEHLVPIVYDKSLDEDWGRLALAWAEALARKERAEAVIERSKAAAHVLMKELKNPKTVKVDNWRIALTKAGALRFSEVQNGSEE